MEKLAYVLFGVLIGFGVSFTAYLIYNAIKLGPMETKILPTKHKHSKKPPKIVVMTEEREAEIEARLLREKGWE